MNNKQINTAVALLMISAAVITLLVIQLTVRDVTYNQKEQHLKQTIGRYELAVELFKEQDSTAANKFVRIFNHETE
jgi:hypothetical protein